jgi:hypothetical protein
MAKPGAIEKVKNVCLVVLFLSTVLLLYFFWGNISFDEFRSSAAEAAGEVPETADLLVPEQIVINFGADSYTVAPAGGIWRSGPGQDSFVEALGKFSSAESIRVEEITEDQYLQVMKLKSVRAEFDYDIPMADFCDIFDIRKPQSYDVIETVTDIGYSTVQGGNSLFICDGKNGRYYRLVADQGEAGNAGDGGFTAFIDSIAADGYNAYYPAGSVLDVENDTLVPLSAKANLKRFPFRQDIYPDQAERISAIAEQFFGSNFDFVRKITEESGTVIYMYGYGQNVLIVNTDGSIEYKEEQAGDSNSLSFSGALEAAVNFVANHGSWEALSAGGLRPYLKDAIPDPDNKGGYRFIFGVEVNGSKLYYEDGDPIVIGVASGQVTYYKRDLVDIDPEDIAAIETASADDTFSAANLIAENYRYIYNILLPSGEVKATADPTEMFEIIAALVKDMKIGYVKPSSGMIAEIQPAWAVRVKDAVIYFDLYTAKPIGYSKGR